MTRFALIVLSVHMLLILPLSASAVDLVSKGVKAGVTYANVAGDGVNSADAKLGFGGGAWINFSLLDQIEIQPEFLYAMKGSRSESDLGESTYSIDYLEMPVLASVSLPVPSPWKPHLQAGPYLGVNTRANLSTETGGETSDMDLKDETQRFDYGVMLGAGIGVERFSLDARYAMGLANTGDPAEGEAPDVKNRSFSLLVGISF